VSILVLFVSVVISNGIFKVETEKNVIHEKFISAFPAANNINKIAFSSDIDGIFTEIYVMNSNGSNQKRITYNSAHEIDLAWSPDGKKIAFSLTEAVIFYDYLMQNHYSYEICLISIDGTSEIIIDTGKRSRHPAWSPDGTKLAFTSEINENYDIFLITLSSGSVRRLTENSNDNWDPSWSPDGQKMCFVSTRDGNCEIYIMNSDGTNQKRLTEDSEFDGLPAWSPDGTVIAFTKWGYAEGISDIFVMDINGNNLKKLTYSDSWNVHPAWSPDGTKIAFTSNRDGSWEIYVMNSDGSNQINVTSNWGTYKNFPTWCCQGLLDPYANIFCPASECYGYDLWSVKCIDGECKKDHIIEENSRDCGYIPTYPPNTTLTPSIPRSLGDNLILITIMVCAALITIYVFFRKKFG